VTVAQRIKDAWFRIRNRWRGRLPIPPGDLIYLVSGHRSAAWFVAGGNSSAQAIREIMRKQRVPLRKCADVLDFGCGVGRIIRHMQATPGPRWHGTDYNPQLVEWCQRHLKFADFRLNTLSDGLPYADASFDLVYCFSVFTHLPEHLQKFWIGELARVLRPRGHIYLTTHGEHYIADALSEEQRVRFRSGQLVVKEPSHAGSNVCNAFHPERYVRKELARGLRVVDFVPCGSRGHAMQDVYVLRKRAISPD
jgi:SAM-dependent methyltransferase